MKPPPIRNALGQIVRPPSAAQKQRVRAWAPFEMKSEKKKQQTATKGRGR